MPSDPKPVMRIEVLKPDAKEAKAIMDDAEYAVMKPSPDGKMAVVQGWNFTLSKAWLFVIDPKGEAVAKIDVDKTP